MATIRCAKQKGVGDILESYVTDPLYCRLLLRQRHSAPKPLSIKPGEDQPDPIFRFISSR